MALIDQITRDMKLAMKAGDKLKLGAIRMLRAAIKDREIDLGKAIQDEDIVALISKQIKQRKESATIYAEAGREELAAKEIAEQGVLAAYLPAAMGEEELEILIAASLVDVGGGGMQAMGAVMAQLRPKIAGRADMSEVSAKVKSALMS